MKDVNDDSIARFVAKINSSSQADYQQKLT